METRTKSDEALCVNDPESSKVRVAGQNGPTWRWDVLCAQPSLWTVSLELRSRGTAVFSLLRVEFI